MGPRTTKAVQTPLVIVAAACAALWWLVQAMAIALAVGAVGIGGILVIQWFADQISP